ncbi:MAG: DsrE family protein [Vagococcus sp.]
MKVIFHINELSKWSSVLANVTNLLEAGRGDVISVEVLANGDAVKGYTDTGFGIIMHELVEEGVRLSSCEHAMKNHDLNKEDLFPFVKTVPAGVLRLVECQTAGYAYIKA